MILASRILYLKKVIIITEAKAKAIPSPLLNETFIPKALLVTTAPFIMTIYDKSGKLVFETNDVSRPWDGLYKKDFLPAPTGSYVWVVSITNELGVKEVYKGTITNVSN